MRVMTMTATFAATFALAGAALAQDAAPAEHGQYQAALERMVTESAQSRCPADVMAEALLTACNSQIAAMGPALQSLGAVESITFVRSEQRAEGGRVEYYAVRHAGGQTLNWGIGGESGGKFEIAFVGG